MKTRKYRIILCLLLLATTQMYAYVERNLLQQSAGLSELESTLITDQQWVPYPDYTDRAAWDKLLGNYKDAYIKRGEKRMESRKGNRLYRIRT